MSKKVGMLQVVERLPGSRYLCICDCGNQRVVLVGHFNTGVYKSCGCHKPQHGHAGNEVRSREYTSYQNMIARCCNPNNKRYKDYGARGITVSDSWRESFVNFLRDMGSCPDRHQIDRIDNNLGYSKENCRWATPKENMANRSITRRWVVYGKVFMSSADAAKEFGVSTSTINAWCKGRTAKGRYYPPKEGCSADFVNG